MLNYLGLNLAKIEPSVYSRVFFAHFMLGWRCFLEYYGSHMPFKSLF
jgi:hypothetical protein